MTAPPLGEANEEGLDEGDGEAAADADRLVEDEGDMDGLGEAEGLDERPGPGDGLGVAEGLGVRLGVGDVITGDAGVVDTEGVGVDAHETIEPSNATIINKAVTTKGLSNLIISRFLL